MSTVVESSPAFSHVWDILPYQKKPAAIKIGIVRGKWVGLCVNAKALRVAFADQFHSCLNSPADAFKELF